MGKSSSGGGAVNDAPAPTASRMRRDTYWPRFLAHHTSGPVVAADRETVPAPEFHAWRRNTMLPPLMSPDCATYMIEPVMSGNTVVDCCPYHAEMPVDVGVLVNDDT